MRDERKGCGHDDHALRPLSNAFAPHVLVACRNDNTLCYARFSGRSDQLLRRETQFRGKAFDFLDKIKEGYSALCRLRAYGINVPDFTYVIADDATDGGVSLFTTIQRVEGENITDIVPVKRNLAREVEHIFVAFLHYLDDARHSGEPFWTDFNIHQFMYGTVQGNPTPCCYLVDIEPYVGRWPIGGCSREVFDRSYLMQLMRIYLDVEWFEGHRNREVKMSKVRALLLQSVRAVPDSPIYDEFRDNLLFLLGKGRR